MLERTTGRLVVRAVDPSTPALAIQWRRLQERGCVGTPFLTWEWFSALAESPTLGRHCVVLVVDRPGGQTVGVLPLEVVPDPQGLRVVRCAAAADLGADHLDVVAGPRDREEVAAAAARYVTRVLRWDMADFEGLLQGGALDRALQRELRWPRCLSLPPEVEQVAVLDLRSEDARQRLARRSARGLKWVRRAGGGFSSVTDPVHVGPALETLMDLHNERFGERSVVFSTPERRAFHLTAATRLAEAGMARVDRLSTADEDLALEYVLLHGERAYGYQSAFRPGAGHSPGRTAMCQSILAAAGQGRVEYDFLRGDEDYKADYTTGSRPDVRLRALRPTPRAAGWLAGRLGRRLVRTLDRRRPGGTDD
ncbi:MAG TPA: GNAT family N-acetyltransferase [Acidimicrobiales bacterium]|nr:GNAT family N-acetyltransferase [Acidimicrobiales bacterium]